MLIKKPNKRAEVMDLIDYVFKDSLEAKEIESFKEKINNGKMEEAMITVRERLAENNKRILNDGISQGINRGIAQGIAQAKTEMIKKLIQMDMPIKAIENISGLTKEEIDKIKNKP